MMKALIAVLFLAVATATSPVRAQEAARTAPIVVEAQGFMERYAADLLAGDREALIARYDPAGMWFVTHGDARATSHAAIADLYRNQWAAPVAFEWKDLSYVPSGADSVSVIGRFIWTGEGGQSVTIAYHALLVRVGDDLRIRIEDETPVPAGNGS